MLFEILEILAQQVEHEYPGLDITLGNVAYLDDTSANTLEDTVVLSLINLSEENTMKNWPNYRTVGNTTVLKQPIINLNLYIIFCVNYGSSKYDAELRDLSKIITFFQGKKVFTQSNTIYNHSPNPMNPLAEMDNFKFHAELYTPTFEEQSYIWGSLGGKQRPSAIYKVSVVQLESKAVQTQAGVSVNFSGNTNQV